LKKIAFLIVISIIVVGISLGTISAQKKYDIQSYQTAFAVGIDKNVQQIVDSKKILLDSDTKIIHETKHSGNVYYVVRYNNALPFASGLEVIREDGMLVLDSNKVKPIFTSIAWTEAAKTLTVSDIQTLSAILLTSNKINNVVSPVYSATSLVLDKVNWLKTKCVGISIVKVCAWDVVTSSYPQISQLESAVRMLHNELSDWKNTSTDVNKNLPKAISGLEKLRGGGELNPTLQNDIEKSLSSFSTLKSKTNQMADRLSSISTTLSTAERSLKSLSNNPLVGNFILDFANYIGGLNNQVVSLKNEAQSFSNTLSTQSKKLVSVTNFAEGKTNELLGFWNARQNAATAVYTTILGMILAVSVVIGVVLIISKKRKTVVKQVTTSSTKFCRKCGISITTTGKFCGKCGNLI